MKGGGGIVGGGGKRRWKVLVIGVLVLVILSMLVPLAFLLGLHNTFHSPGIVTVQPSSPFERSRINATKHSQTDLSERVDQVLQKINPVLPKKTEITEGYRDMNRTSISDSKNRGLPVSPAVVANPSPANKTKTEVSHKGGQGAIVNADETQRTCQVKYGSYCLWREENKEPMKDAKVKHMKDLLFVARAYYPSIAKMPSQSQLTRDMKQNIQEFERVLIVSSADDDLPPQVDKKFEKMEAVISKAKSFPVDCNNVDKKLRQILDLTEDEASFHMKQSVFLYQLAVHTMPKSLHCLSMRLTVEYFKSGSVDTEDSEKFSDPSLLHFVIISDNILASSVVINSTVLHARESRNFVFHVLTSEQNYFAMKQWFIRNPCKQAAIQVLNIEKLELDSSDRTLSLPTEFRVSFLSGDNLASQGNRTHYLSMFSQSHYLLPKIFHKLKKVVILDHDVVVQRDLSPLWELDMEGKVNGAVKECSVRLGQLKSLKGGSFDANACLWMSGLNVIDLARWRELGVTEAYHKFYKQQMSGGGESREEVALQASLLAFQDKVYALDDRWAVSGLGYDYYINTQTIKNAATLHYNGNMKPWLELGIPQYKDFWRNHLNREDRFLSDCNVNP
ncbi:putative galacturonosyltransferase 7 [Raphanus sativus]|uniref:Hexosyltransferase n=1 Tax=Raphanus sativus TaxID=3726 RepID=A0A6J0MVZ7_RAPSA|nr:probable galacturonosyltransferase 7 isoform X1 [Raphanus sativus]XP_056855196.1 probable galacturonosyltransferase 7 isoform X1 [Raphanus sativus]KAJ4869133.1 putative galacturonosyltransferase 7 [Raphanus sativus]KAJ4906867.1 putative galacturonosyltransferase 7 [Raphanus sativus]